MHPWLMERVAVTHPRNSPDQSAPGTISYHCYMVCVSRTLQYRWRDGCEIRGAFEPTLRLALRKVDTEPRPSAWPL